MWALRHAVHRSDASRDPQLREDAPRLLRKSKERQVTEPTLRVVARMKARAGKGSELRDLLQGLVEPTRKEPGCITYELLENNDDPGEFTFVEEWTDGKALDAHFATEHIKHALERLPELLAGDLDLRKYTCVR